MDRKLSMDPSQVAMLGTENEAIYMAERTKGDYFQTENDPDKKGTGVTKEPTVALMAIGIYPLTYLLDFFKLAKANKASHMKIEMGRENRPLRLEFLSYDNLNQVNGSPKIEKTWFFLAPRIDSNYPDPTVEQINAAIQLHENEIVLLRNQLPKETPKPL